MAVNDTTLDLTDLNALNPKTATPTATATSWAPTTGTASTGTAFDWNVDNKSTVGGQMAGLLEQNSPYMQAAKTQALQMGNQRGLLNSSMTAGAGTLAAIQSSLPIAQQDAQTFAQAGQWNAVNKTNMSQFNAGQNQTMTLANLDAQSYVRNTRLLSRLKEGECAPHDIASMPPDQVFPEQWAEVIRAKMQREEYMLTARPAAMTDQFLCGRCKKRECTFTEMQMRSCDEPATLFIQCLTCGNRWRLG
jgi:DNA-directed RNA polymerase subunit M/transcription elongation factor TFIIS